MTFLPPGSIAVYATEPELGRPLAPPRIEIPPARVYRCNEGTCEQRCCRITFAAACPTCGQDATWTGQRNVHAAKVTAIDCPCDTYGHHGPGVVIPPEEAPW